jgi:hypothetical protein
MLSGYNVYHKVNPHGFGWFSATPNGGKNHVLNMYRYIICTSWLSSWCARPEGGVSYYCNSFLFWSVCFWRLVIPLHPHVFYTANNRHMYGRRLLNLVITWITLQHMYVFHQRLHTTIHFTQYGRRLLSFVITLQHMYMFTLQHMYMYFIQGYTLQYTSRSMVDVC